MSLCSLKVLATDYVALGMAAAGEYIRRVDLYNFAFVMSDYVFGLLLLSTDVETMQQMVITWPIDIVFCRNKQGYRRCSRRLPRATDHC